MNRDLLKLSAACLFIALVCLWVVFSTGCSSVIRNTGVEKGVAPTSNLSRSESADLAQLIALLNNGSYSAIAPTGSLEPIVNSHSFVVMVPHQGNLRVGMVVGFRHSDEFPHVLHRVAMVNDTHFIPDGITNRHYDGWIPRENIYGELIAVVYSNEGIKP